MTIESNHLQYDDPVSNLVCIPKATMDRLLKTERPAEALALYTFYCYTAKWQNTNQPKCTVSYIAKGLSWGIEKTREIKKILENIELIEEKQIRKDGKITGWCVHVKYITTLGVSLRVGRSDTNALSTGIIRDTKVSPAKQSSAGVAPVEFEFDGQNLSPYHQWIFELTSRAKQTSLSAGATQPFSIPTRKESKYIQKVEKYILDISNGKFLEYKFDETFMKHVDQKSIRTLESLKGAPVDLIKEVIEFSLATYLQARNDDRYDFISRDRKIDFGAFLYEYNEKNNVLGISPFLKYLGITLETKSPAEVPERMLSSIYKKDLSKMYRSIHNDFDEFDESEMVRLIKSCLSLCRWWKQNEGRLQEIYRGSLKTRFPKGMETFIEHYYAGYVKESKFEHPIMMIPGKKYWVSFGDYIYDYTEIDLDAKPKDKKKRTEMTIEEINRRMEED